MCRAHVLFLLLTLLGSPLQAQESSCCSKVTGSCRLACQKMSMVDIAVDPGTREMRLSHVKDFCPQQLDIFWDCLNKTIEEVLRGEEWSGRTCCPLPQSALCQQSCVTAASHKDLLKHCRHSDELAFFSCLEHQKAGDECCSGARTAPCKEACRSIFKSQATPSVEARVAVEEACGEVSPRVLTCVHNHTKGTPALDPHKYVQCCEKASHGACRDACRRVLRSKTTDQEIVDSLQEAGCGPPMPHEKLWQCFLQKHEAPEAADLDLSRIDRMGMDAAKLHCCPRASTPSCRRLCAKTFSNEWARHWDQFNSECLSQITEDALVHCLDEVEEPCELGCEGLHYCSTFNNRPTELFRSCSRQADEAARYDVALWARQGSLPGLASFPVLDIASCAPRAWKTVACTLQIKPCHRHAHVNRICRQDCYELLSQCIDWSRMPPDHTAASLCSKLSPDSEEQPCISLKPFLQPSDRPHVAPQDGVTMPCKGVHPCNGSEVCVVNRNCAPGRPCQMYHCVPGCRLGEVSQYVVPKGTFVHIPVNSVGLKGCTKICQCSGHGSLVHCEGLPCSHKDACWLGATKIDHNTWFYIECNLCSCFSGEITCSKRQCEVGDPAYTSLPCNCPPHYVPVCARNGNTYASACLAKCAGLSDAELEFGPCSAKDPCARHSCARGQQCVPARRVCLAHTHKPCVQYQCVDNPVDCSSKPHDPVCDTEGQEHPNLCFLLDYWKTLAYKGPCLVNCDRRSVVCGFNGVTYRSECEAHADRVGVDYRGPCSAVGLLGGGTGPLSRCPDSGVRCPPLAQADCVGLTPPGACCPICAGAVRFLYSHKQVERALYGSRGSQAALTVASLLGALERHVQVSECSVRGYASVEAELVVVVQARDRPKPSALQLETCVREAEKLAALVRRGSPRVLSELSLSVLSNAVAVAHAPLVSGATSSPSTSITLCGALLFAVRKLLC